MAHIIHPPREIRHVGVRAAGCLIGLACGDALGAHYEFGPVLGSDVPVDMIGGGPFGFAPGEFTDDTAMALGIARGIVPAHHRTDPAGADAIDMRHVLTNWLDWLKVTKDVGVQTGAILGQLRRDGRIDEESCRALSQRHHAESGNRSGGNGALMRTAPVALAFLHDTTGLAAMARRIAQLTHWEDAAGDACVLWCFAIVHAIHTGELNIRVGLDELPEERRGYWSERIAEAESATPAHFSLDNGWVVSAFRAAWSAIHHSIIELGRIDVVDALERAVRGGNDTDTVAAIAGSLIGAAAGAAVFPARWREILHGWSIDSERELIALALTNAEPTRSRDDRWPLATYLTAKPIGTLARHPHDDGVWLGSMDILDHLPADVTAVVSICRTGTQQVPAENSAVSRRVEFWLVDDVDANIDATTVVVDAADTVARLRSEGHVVFLHCVAAHSRTPTIAAAYSARHLGRDCMTAHEEVRAVLPQHSAWRNPDFIALLERLPLNS
ncbi:MAG: ADP-ribosylglycohydrolase family protein [Microbacteriaceae bacterium]